MSRNMNINEQAFKLPRQYGSFKSSGTGSYFIADEDAEHRDAQEAAQADEDVRVVFNATHSVYARHVHAPVSLKKFSYFARIHSGHVLCEAARCFYEKDSEKEAA